jgi:hypothetical protein
MTTLYHRVEDQSRSILYNTAETVVKALLEDIGQSEYMEEAIYITSGFTTTSDYTDGNGNVNMIRNRCNVKLEYVLDKSQVPWPVETPYTTTASLRGVGNVGRHPLVLIDADSSVMIEYQTVPCALNLDFELIYQSYDDALRAMDVLMTKYRGTLLTAPFDIPLDMSVPRSLIEFLVFVYTSKEDYKNKTFLQYLQDKQITRFGFDVRKSDIGSDDPFVELKVHAIQSGAQCQVTMDQNEPEADMVDNLPDSFSVKFRAQFQFGRPIAFIVNCQPAIDNNLIPAELFSSKTAQGHYNPKMSTLYDNIGFSTTFSTSADGRGQFVRFNRYPEYDDWVPRDSLYLKFEYNPLLIQHFTLDPGVTQIDLKAMGDIELNPIAIDILTVGGQSVLEFGSLLHVGIWADDTQMTSGVSISDDLVVSIDTSIKSRNYRLVISETTNIQYTDLMWNSILMKYRYFFPLTIARNISELIDVGCFVTTVDSGFYSTLVNMSNAGTLGTVLSKMIADGDDTSVLLGYASTTDQLTSYLVDRNSMVRNYTLPTDASAESVKLRYYYSKYASVKSRSLLTVFVGIAFSKGYLAEEDIPSVNFEPNREVFPLFTTDGGYYGINTPFRVLSGTISR